MYDHSLVYGSDLVRVGSGLLPLVSPVLGLRPRSGDLTHVGFGAAKGRGLRNEMRLPWPPAATLSERLRGKMRARMYASSASL